MRTDLKTPCKNCPFRTDETGIRFACRERAEEIEEQAYRNGFPCHLSAELVEDDDSGDGESGGFMATEDGQHCIGFIIMMLKTGAENCWPGLDNDEELVARIAERIDWNAPVFENAEEFFDANTKGTEP